MQSKNCILKWHICVTVSVPAHLALGQQWQTGKKKTIKFLTDTISCWSLAPELNQMKNAKLLWENESIILINTSSTHSIRNTEKYSQSTAAWMWLDVNKIICPSLGTCRNNFTGNTQHLWIIFFFFSYCAAKDKSLDISLIQCCGFHSKKCMQIERPLKITVQTDIQLYH